jgi:hypothetical protein
MVVQYSSVVTAVDMVFCTVCLGVYFVTKVPRGRVWSNGRIWSNAADCCWSFIARRGETRCDTLINLIVNDVRFAMTVNAPP